VKLLPEKLGNHDNSSEFESQISIKN